MTAAPPELVLRAAAAHFPEGFVRTAELVAAERPAQLFRERLRKEIGAERVHVAGPADSPSSLALAAGRAALERAGLAGEEIELVLSVTVTPSDFDMWSLPASIARDLGARRAECIGIAEVGCAGAFAALRTVRPMMLAPDGPRTALIVTGCVTLGHRFFPPATIFGDGGGAMVLERADPGRRVDGPLRLVRADFRSHPHLLGAFGCLSGSNLLRAEGRLEPAWWTVGVRDPSIYAELGRTNLGLGAELLSATLARAGWAPGTVRWLLPDNVAETVGRSLAHRIGVDRRHVLTENCTLHGHAFMVDPFLNLETILTRYPPEPGDRLACVGMGLGQHWGVALMEGRPV